MRSRSAPSSRSGRACCGSRSTWRRPRSRGDPRADDKVIAIRQWLPLALCLGCAALPARAAILPTDLEAKVGVDYAPADADERAIWQDLSRLEAGIRGSRQRLVA